MKLDDLRRVIRYFQSMTSMLAVTSLALAQTPVPCNSSDPTHPQEVSCGSPSCPQTVGATCWGPPGVSWANGFTYAGGRIEVINGVRNVRAYAYGPLETYADALGEDYLAHVWSKTPQGFSVHCADGSSTVQDYNADGQYVNKICTQTATIQVFAYTY